MNKNVSLRRHRRIACGADAEYLTSCCPFTSLVTAVRAANLDAPLSCNQEEYIYCMARA